MHEPQFLQPVAAPKTRPMDIGFDLRGRHADGTEFPVEISLSPSRASGHGTAIIVVMQETSRQRAALILDEDERIAADSHDRVIGHLLRGGLTLAGILGRCQVESEVAERIHEVMNQLDSAVAEIRKTVFDRLTTHQP